MEEVHCPNCASRVSRAEIAVGRCEMCGEQLASDRISAGSERGGSHRGDTGLMESARCTLRKLTNRFRVLFRRERYE